MKSRYDAIVAGGGIAGLTCTAYLSKYGYKTLLCEKEEKTGGLVNTFGHEGYMFDGGIRAFENSGILFPMLKSLDIDIDFVEDDVYIGIADKGIKIAAKEDLNGYISMLSSIFPDEKVNLNSIKDEIEKVMEQMDVLYGIDNPLFLENMRDRDYLVKTLLPWLLKYIVNISKVSKMNDPVREHLGKFTSSKPLIDMITQHFFKDTPAFFALSYFGLYPDYCYPKGGTGILASKLEEFIRNAGGDISTATAINEIDTSAHMVSLSDGSTVSYNKLVWAADLKTLYSITSGKDNKEIKMQRSLVQNNTGGDSVISLYLGISKDSSYFAEKCGTHAFYTPVTDGLSTVQSWEEIEQGNTMHLYDNLDEYLKKTTYEISCPSLRDSSMAPKGKTGVIVSTLLDHGLVKLFAGSGEYENMKNFCTEKMIRVLSDSIFPGLERSIEFSICSTPLTIEKMTGNSGGAITGWAFNKDTIPCENRLKKIAKSVQTPFEDIFQCGQWSFSPSGMPISVLTGKLAADAVKKASGKA